MTEINNQLTLRKIFVFWMPLAATWLMMSVEGPYLSAVIARMSEPKFNLAAYGVAFSFAIIIEAPVIMMMSASIALIKGLGSFQKLKKFVYAINIITTTVMLLFNYSPVFYFITETLIGLPREVSSLTHVATIILIPWPAAIGYRRFYQGVMTHYNQTRRVAYGTIVRLSFMFGTALILFLNSNLQGAYVGAAALAAGVLAEAVASKLMSTDLLQKLEKENPEEDEILSMKEIFKFYYPLALTSFMGLAVHPMITFFVGQSRMALESLAVLPVINSLVFIFRSMGLSFQEVSIALLGDKFENHGQLKKFATITGISVVLLLATISLTPLSFIWFHDLSGLSVELAEFSILPLIILTVFPGLAFLVSFQRSILVCARKTKQVTMGTVVEVTGIIFILSLAIGYFNLPGAVAVAVSLLIGRFFANMYLHFPSKKALFERRTIREE